MVRDTRFRLNPAEFPLGGAADWNHLRSPARRAHVVYNDFLFGSDEQAPAPDPAIGQAAVANAETSKAMVQIAQDQLAWNREKYAQMEPLLRESFTAQTQAAKDQLAFSKEQFEKLSPMLQDSILRQSQIAREQLDFSRDQYARMEPYLIDALKSQASISADNQSRATEQWNRWKSIFAPIEDQYAKEASNYGTEADQQEQAAAARAGVATQFEATRAASDRDLARSGVTINPGSDSALARRKEMDIAQASAEAGAGTMAARNARLTGMAMREGVAKFGRGMPSTGLAADAAALSGASGSAGTAGANVGMSNAVSGSAAPWFAGTNNTIGGTLAAGNAQGASALPFYNAALGTAGGMTSLGNAGASSALPWFSGGVNAMGSAGNLYLGQYGAQMQGYKAQTESDGQMFGALGTLGGAALSSIGTWGPMVASAFSSKKLKENMRSVAAKGILAKIETLPVEKWKYKAGVADEGEHIGPYAEDVQERFGDSVAPGGKMIDLISMNGIALAGVKALLERVKTLEHGAANEAEREAVAA